jgi:hypothetical protein
MAAEHGDSSLRVYVAFAALAVLAGPVNGYAAGAILVATQWQVFAGLALASLLAGGGLVGFAAARKQRMPGARQWAALLLLVVPQWCSVPFSSLANPVPWLHGIGWGTALLLSLAAPLWLGLIAACDLMQVEVPRSVVAAAIVGIGAVCLVVPTDAYRVGLNQVPMVVLQSLLGIATVVSWVIARPWLEGWSVAWVAGGYLLLSGLGDVVFALVYERSAWQPLVGRSLVVPLLCDAAVLGAVWWLWFWLLQRMTLAAFGMRALAAWTAALVPGIAMQGFLEWRLDAALAIAVAAIAVALRARVGDEQPMALGLGET